MTCATGVPWLKLHQQISVKQRSPPHGGLFFLTEGKHMSRLARKKVPNLSARPAIEPMEVDMGPGETVELPSDGPVPARPSRIERQTDILGFKTKAEELSFNEEKLEIMIHQATDENAEKRVFVGNNGRGVWLERGRNYRIARKYVEQLLRAKPVGIQTVQALDYDGHHTTNILKSRAMLYPLSIIEDKSPRAHRWLTNIMAQP
jgi:hypothetical protein